MLRHQQSLPFHRVSHNESDLNYLQLPNASLHRVWKHGHTTAGSQANQLLLRHMPDSGKSEKEREVWK